MGQSYPLTEILCKSFVFRCTYILNVGLPKDFTFGTHLNPDAPDVVMTHILTSCGSRYGKVGICHATVMCSDQKIDNEECAIH